MKKLAGFLVLAVAIGLFTGCDQQPYEQSWQDSKVPVKKPAPDISAILANAVELREEKLFLVTLEFKKEQVTLDLWKHAKNSMAAESRTLIVDEQTFYEYSIGKKVSSVGDGWGFVFNGEIAEYVVRTAEKQIESQYFWADRNGTQTEISREQYDEAKRQLRSGGRRLFTVSFAGVARTYVLEKPLTEYQFIDRQPLNRYFVTIQIENSSFTLDLTKHIRNWANTHKITLEVPREVYEKGGDAWNAQLSTGSIVVKGHLSKLHGKVIRRWSKVDNNFELAKTADGQQFIVPK